MTNRTRAELDIYTDQYVTITCNYRSARVTGLVVAVAELFRGGGVVVVLRQTDAAPVAIHDHLIDTITPLTFDQVTALGLDGTLRNT